MRHVAPLHRRADRLNVFRAFTLPRAEVRVSAHRDHLANRVDRLHLALRNDADALCQLSARPVIQASSIEEDRSGDGCERSKHQPQQGRLAGTIRSEDGREAAISDE